MSVNSLDSDSVYSGDSNDIQDQGLVPVTNALCHQSRSGDGVVNPEPYKSRVNANLSKCESVQLGNKFIADKITFVIGNSETRSLSQDNVATSVFDTFKVNGDINKTKIHFKIVNIFLLLLLVVLFFTAIDKVNKISESAPHYSTPQSTLVFVNVTPTEVQSSTISVEPVSNSNHSPETSLAPEITTKEDKSGSSITYRITTIPPMISYSSTESSTTQTDVEKTTENTKTLQLWTRLTSVQTTKDYKDITDSMQTSQLSSVFTSVQTTKDYKGINGTMQTSKLSSEFTSVQTTKDYKGTTDTTFGTSTNIPTASRYESEPHYNESFLILSKMYRGFQIDPIPEQKYVPSSMYKSIGAIEIEFYPTYCQLLSTCLKYMKQIPQYPDIDYNFILLGNIVYVARGWKAPIKPDKQSDPMFFSILFMLRDSHEMSEKQMYMYLILINSSIRCGYLETNFTVMIRNDKYHRSDLGYSKFINIVNKSTENKYYVDERDEFVSDSKNISAQIPKPCPVFKTCNNTCEDQNCLQTVCENTELCFLQCL